LFYQDNGEIKITIHAVAGAMQIRDVRQEHEL